MVVLADPPQVTWGQIPDSLLDDVLDDVAAARVAIDDACAADGAEALTSVPDTTSLPCMVASHWCRVQLNV